MQGTGFFDKNVVKNHQFTPACSLNIYLALTPTPTPNNLEFFLNFIDLFGYLRSSPVQKRTFSLRTYSFSYFKFGYLRSAPPPPRIEPSHGEFRIFFELYISLPQIIPLQKRTFSWRTYSFSYFKFGYLKSAPLPPQN